MKRFLFLCLLFLSIATCVFSQARVNRPPLKYNATTLPLKKVMGYRYNKVAGQWIDKKNEVSIADDQDFILLEVKTIEYENKMYYLFSVTREKGFYDYPSLKVGFHTSVVTTSYCFTEEEFSKIFNLSNTVTSITSFNQKFNVGADLNLSTFIFDLKYVDKPIIKDVLQIKLSDEGFVRFLLPISEYKLNNLVGVDTNLPFNTNYFEISQNEFYKWLEPIRPKAPVVKVIEQ